MAEERAEMSPRGSGGPDGVELKFTSSGTYRGGLRAGAAGTGRNHPSLRSQAHSCVCRAARVEKHQSSWGCLRPTQGAPPPPP